MVALLFAVNLMVAALLEGTAAAQMSFAATLEIATCLSSGGSGGIASSEAASRSEDGGKAHKSNGCPDCPLCTMACQNCACNVIGVAAQIAGAMPMAGAAMFQAIGWPEQVRHVLSRCPSDAASQAPPLMSGSAAVRPERFS